MEKKGTYIDEKGYLRDTYGKLIHRQIAYQLYLKKLGKYHLPFPQYDVHHINSDKLDNDEDNLYICLRDQHDKIHKYQKEHGNEFKTEEEINIFLNKEPKKGLSKIEKDWKKIEKNVIKKVGRGRIPSLEKEREREKYNFPYEVPQSVMKKIESGKEKKKLIRKERKKPVRKSKKLNIQVEREKQIQRQSEILREIKRRKKPESVMGSMKTSFWIFCLVFLLFWTFGTPFLISLLVGLSGFLIALIISIIK